MASAERRAVRHVGADLTEVVLICRKCSKKMNGGFGPKGDRTLAKAMRRALAARPGGAGRKPKALRRTLGVMEVDCLDLCPKNAIVVLRADRPGDWVLVSKGTGIGEVIDHLGLGRTASEVP